jgi:uncharacterized membrane protein (UPF0136 family)
MLQFGRLALLVYPFLMLLGGILGYASKKSVPSLIAGAGSAAVLLATYAFTRSQPKTGLWIGACVAVLMFVSLWMRYQKSGSLYPAGIFSIISIVAALIFVASALSQNR